MLEIQIADTLIPLQKDMSLTFATSFPAFSTENIRRAYSLPLKLTWSDILKAKLMHGNRLDSDGVPPTLPTILYYGGLELTQGILKSDEGKSNTESYEGYFAEAGRDVMDKLNDIKLSDILPKVVVPQVLPAALVLELLTPTATVGLAYILHFNEKTYSFTATGTSPGNVYGGIAALINADYPGVAMNQVIQLTITLSEALSPPFSLVDGFKLKSHNNFSASVYNNFVLFLKDSLVTPRSDIAFNRVEFIDFYNGTNPDFSRLSNRHNYAHRDGLGEWQLDDNEPSETAVFLVSYIPFFRLKYVMNQCAIAAGATKCSSKEAIWSDIESALIDNNYALDNMRQDYFYDVPNNTTNLRYLNCFVKEILPMQHVNDMTARQLLDAVANTFNLEYAYLNNEIVFKLKNEPFKVKRQLDITNKLLLNPQRGYKKDAGYTLQFKKDDSEKLPEHLKKVIGAGKELIELPIGTLRMNATNTVAISQREGANSVMGEKNFPLRIFFDTGYVEAYSGYMSTIIGEAMTLTIEGLYDVCWKGTAELRSKGYEITLYALLSADEFYKIVNQEITSVYLASKEGTISAYIKSAEAPLSTKEGLLVVKLELLK